MKTLWQLISCRADFLPLPLIRIRNGNGMYLEILILIPV